MPFVTDYTPISSVLQLGGIAGAGRAMAQQKAQQLQDQAQAQQIAQQNIQNQIQAQQAQNQADAQQHANDIQTGLAYAQLQNQKQEKQDQLQQQQVEAQAKAVSENAQLGQNAQNRTEQSRQFNSEQAIREQGQQFQQNKYDQAQQSEADKEKAVNEQIDQMAPPGSEENLRLHMIYRANGRIQAPTTVNPAQSLSVINTRMKLISDPTLGGPLAGHEEEYRQLEDASRQIQEVLRQRNVPGAPPLTARPVGSTPGISSAPTVSATPAIPAAPSPNYQFIAPPGATPTGHVSSEGLPVVSVMVNGQQTYAVTAIDSDAIDAVPAGELFITAVGKIARKK